MSRKYSVLMVVLLVAASLIGISSIYQPANVETQPQTQIPGTKGLITREQSGKALQLIQSLEDKKLVDRLFPHIIKKIDANSNDAKTIATKLLPYLNIQNNVVPSVRGVTTTLEEGANPFKMISYCPQGSVLIGGGFLGPGDMVNSYLGEGGAIVFVQGTPEQTGHYAVQAYCLNSQLVAK
jgi:hypothetical protein